jgi:hypothetical protein
MGSAAPPEPAPADWGRHAIIRDAIVAPRPSVTATHVTARAAARRMEPTSGDQVNAAAANQRLR